MPPPFRSCIKLLKLNSCQFTSKQLQSHWCCLFRGSSSTQWVSTHFVLIQVITSLRLRNTEHILKSETDYPLYKVLMRKIVVTFRKFWYWLLVGWLVLVSISILSNILSIATNLCHSNLAFEAAAAERKLQ